MESKYKYLVVAGMATTTLVIAYCKYREKKSNQECMKQKKSGADIRSMMFGIAIGDAAGVGIEFQSREVIRKILDESIEKEKYLNMRDGNWGKGYKAGMYSDDTEMSIGTAEAMINTPVSDISIETLLEYWTREWKEFEEEHHYGRQGHGSIRDVYEGRCTIEEVQKRQASKEHPGNAPGMRAIPLAFIEDEHNTFAIMNADSTHPHPQARASSILIVQAAKYLFQGGNHIDLIKNIKEYIKDVDNTTYHHISEIDKLDDYHDLIKEDRDDVDWVLLCGPQPMHHPRFTINGLPCSSMHTAGLVLYLLKYFSGSILDLLKHSLKVGGDVDSLGSICLGIACGRYGLGDLPVWMIEEVEGGDKLEDVSLRFSQKFGDVF